MCSNIFLKVVDVILGTSKAVVDDVELFDMQRSASSGAADFKTRE